MLDIIDSKSPSKAIKSIILNQALGFIPKMEPFLEEVGHLNVRPNHLTTHNPGANRLSLTPKDSRKINFLNEFLKEGQSAAEL